MQYLSIAEHVDQRRMYVTLRRKFYWPPKSAIAERVVRECQWYAQNGPEYGHKRDLQRFSAVGPV